MLIMVCFSIFVTAGYYSSQSRANFVIAQDEELPADFVCDFPIPAANALKSSVKLIDSVYQEYQVSTGYLNAVISTLNGVFGSIGSDNVCDFSECFPKSANAIPGSVSNISFDFDLDLATLFQTVNLVNIRPPLCVPGKCVGDPCKLGELRDYLKELKSLENLFATSYNNIHTLFSEPTEIITYDLALTTNGATDEGGLLTKQDAILREIDVADRELEFCKLTAVERKRKMAGEHIERNTMRCDLALEAGVYWPRAWSEKCTEECSFGDATEECIACLAKCEGTSVLADINCKIYREGDYEKCGVEGKCCGLECKKGMTAECNSCLRGSSSDQEYRDWLCWGTDRNPVCCYKGSLDE